MTFTFSLFSQAGENKQVYIHCSGFVGCSVLPIVQTLQLLLCVICNISLSQTAWIDVLLF